MTVSENEFFRQATLRISSSLTIETAMKNCMDYMKRWMPISGMFFGLYDPDLNIGKLLATIWPETMQKPGSTISIPGEFWDVMKEKFFSEPEIRIINDVDAEPREIRKVISLIWPPETSHIKMDLALDEERLGLFVIFTEGKHRYRETHARLVSLLHEPFAVALSNMLRHQEILRLKDMLADDNRYLHRRMMEMTGDTIVGADFGLRNVMRMVRQVAPLNSPVLLMGETGVGKEVIANAIHHFSQRKGRPYIKVNCGAIPENLIDSELFGHEKGAFTGALSRKRGRFERAHNGTIFLDEIGELPPPAQVRLLRVLQQHEIERVGGAETIPVDARVISATNRNLTEMVGSGRFREDLWFRLNVFPIIIPPLRRRTVDIPALVNHFLERKSKELKIRDLPSLAPGAVEKLQAYKWPGNVRELENLVERALILSQMTEGGSVLTFNPHSGGAVSPTDVITVEKEEGVRPLDDVITDHIQRALAHAEGRVEGENGAARMLGLHPSTLRGRMTKLGIPHGRQAKLKAGAP